MKRETVFRWIQLGHLPIQPIIRVRRKPFYCPSVVQQAQEVKNTQQRRGQIRAQSTLVADKQQSGMYTIADIQRRFGISRHTVYGYRKAGVLPPPIGGRRFAFYTDEHLNIIQGIQDRMQSYKQNTLASRSQSSRSMSNTIRSHVWDKSDGICHYCHGPLHPFRNFHVDHVHPVTFGGTSDLKNLVASCKTCNMSKGSKSYEDFIIQVSRPTLNGPYHSRNIN